MSENQTQDVVAPVEAAPPPPPAVVPAPPPVNPLLERVRIPGETHRLPSQGLFYNNGELSPDVKNGEIHIHPMTAHDEIVIRSVDKLFSGEAIVEVFGRCVPQVLNPRELLAKDVDFIMVCLRKISYGAGFEMNYTHDCADAKEHVYIIEMEEFIKSVRSIDPTMIAKKFTKTLDNGQVVKIHPLRYGAVIKLMQATDLNPSEDEQAASLIDSLVDVIEIVDEITDREFIRQWLVTLSAGWIRELSEVIDQSSDWGASFTTTVVCKDCDEKMEIAAPMNPLTFFF